MPSRISIITVCRNAAATIEQTLLSVLGQNYPNLEYIVIDGGSTDGTWDVISKYRSCLAYAISETDNGIYDAFNKGLAQANGDIIGILNADDQYSPLVFNQINNEYQKNPNCGVFYGKLVVINKEQKRWTVYPLGSHLNLLNSMSIAHPATFVTKEMYSKHGLFDINYKIVADWDFILRLYLAGEKFCPINRVLAAFSNSGISSCLSRRLVAENSSIYRKYHSFGGAWGRNLKLEAKYWGRQLLTRINLYAYYSRYREERIFHREAFGVYKDMSTLWNSLNIRNLKRENQDA